MLLLHLLKLANWSCDTMQTEIDNGKREIIRRFNENVRGKKADSSTANSRHDGKDGHWLEVQMGIAHNRSNEPDLFDYEMKNQTTNKTTFGDWSADYYLFKDKSLSVNRNEFLALFGKANIEKDGRFSWSGEPCPKINAVNMFGQILIVDALSNIVVLYRFSQDMRSNKASLIPARFQVDNLVLARWDAQSIRQKLERKFNQKGWFKCLKNEQGIYDAIVFGRPINFDSWLQAVRTGAVFFDSGMYQTNSRNYSMWRANNRFWDSLIISRY